MPFRIIDIELRSLDEPIVCGGCGVEVTEARLTELARFGRTFWLYECPNCGDNLFGSHSHDESSRSSVD